MTKTNSSALIVPPPNPRAHATATTNELRDIRDIRAPVPIPNHWIWVAWILTAATALALAWWAWRRWRRKLSEPKLEPVIPPHERARARLRDALALIDQPQPFCIAVSDTARVYLEERFSLHAPERTTEEFLDELQSSPLLTLDQKQTLGEFLARCDLVKFARYEPARTELEAIYNAAVRLIEETEPGPVNAQNPGAGAAVEVQNSGSQIQSHGGRGGETTGAASPPPNSAQVPAALGCAPPAAARHHVSDDSRYAPPSSPRTSSKSE